MAARSASAQPRDEAGEEASPVRQRILGAAFKVFTKNGYAGTSTLEIATRAQVSKRELYALVGNKREMLTACISARAKRLQIPADLPELRDRATFMHALAAVGRQLLHEISDPGVIAIFRLAIGEAVRAPEVARAFDSIGGEASRVALREIMRRAKSAGLFDGRPDEMAEQFAGLLWGNLMVGLLLRVTDRPNPHAIAQRARDATAAFLKLYPQASATPRRASSMK